ncbi:MAG: hypothetical protein ACKOXB_13380 [Flavobacteriales bacterium]
MTKNFKEFLLIQEKLKGHSFAYKGVSLLPFLRMAFCYNDYVGAERISAAEVNQYKQKLGFKQKIGLALYFFSKYLKSPVVATNYFNHPRKVDNLFFAIPSHNKVKGEAMNNVWVTPLIKCYQEKRNTEQQLLWNYTEEFSTYWALDKKYNLATAQNFFLSAFGFKSRLISEIDGFSELFDLLKQSSFGITITMGALQSRIENLLLHIEFYKKVYRAYQPKAVFVYSFYYDANLAAVYAAKAMGIKTIDVQHGLIKFTHYAYTDWKGLKKDELLFLPDYCLTHDEETAEVINNSEQGMKGYFTGNVNKATEVEFRKTQKAEDSFLIPINPATRNILITAIEHILHKDILSVVRNAKQFTWHIKLHPRYTTAEMLQHYQDMFQEVSHVHVYHKEKADLYDFLELCDLHITEMSYSAIEAEEQGLNNIIFGEGGKEQFHHQIAEGKYISCVSAAELEKVLSREESFLKKAKTNEQSLEKVNGRLLKFYEEMILKSPV